MKKIIFLVFCAVAFLLSGCTKEEAVSPRSGKLHPVKFSVSTFERQIVPMAGLNKNAVANALSNNALPDVIQSITYVVFDESGDEVSRKVSYASDQNFGTIEDELPEGSYKVTFSGSDMNEIDISDTYRGWIRLHPAGKGDIFYKEIDLIVGAGGASTEAVVMIRKVGKIEIVPLDKIPPRVDMIQYTVHNVATTFSLRDHSGRNNSDITTYVFYKTDQEAGILPDYSQALFTNFFLDQDLPAIASVSIKAYDQKGKTIVDMVIHDVPVAINKKTILTGNLFGNLAEQNFSVILEDKWNSETININY